VDDTPKVSSIFYQILSDIIHQSHGEDYLSDEDDNSEVMVENSDGEEEPVGHTKEPCSRDANIIIVHER
jgi:hypothetical protein